jgi:hypothetical protein
MLKDIENGPSAKAPCIQEFDGDWHAWYPPDSDENGPETGRVHIMIVDGSFRGANGVRYMNGAQTGTWSDIQGTHECDDQRRLWFRYRETNNDGGVAEGQMVLGYMGGPGPDIQGYQTPDGSPQIQHIHMNRESKER